jgi:hypothetical protein
VRTPSCVLDGEVCALDERGRSSFSAMQTGEATAIVYYVFDVLEVEGTPVTGLLLGERRERLESLLDPSVRAVRLSESFDDGEGRHILSTPAELERRIERRQDGANDFWIAPHGDEYPALAVMVRHEHAVVHYFTEEHTAGLQSMTNLDDVPDEVGFVMQHEPSVSHLPGNVAIDWPTARRSIEQFVENPNEPPPAIDWREL